MGNLWGTNVWDDLLETSTQSLKRLGLGNLANTCAKLIIVALVYDGNEDLRRRHSVAKTKREYDWFRNLVAIWRSLEIDENNELVCACGEEERKWLDKIWTQIKTSKKTRGGPSASVKKSLEDIFTRNKLTWKRNKGTLSIRSEQTLQLIASLARLNARKKTNKVRWILERLFQINPWGYIFDEEAGDYWANLRTPSKD